MRYIYKIAHRMLKYAPAFWLTLIILPLIQLFWNNALTPAKGFLDLLSKSILAILFLPGMNLALTLSTLGLLLLLNFAAWIIVHIEKRNKKKPSVSPKKGVCVKQWKAYDTFIFKVVWSPNGNLLTSVGSEGIVRLWDGNSFLHVKQLSPESELVDWLFSLAWSPDSLLLIAAGEDKESRIWDVKTGTVQKLFRHPTSPILSLGWFTHGIGIVAENGWSAFLSFPTSDVWQPLSTTALSIQTASWTWNSDMLAIATTDGELLVQSGSVRRSITHLDPEGQQVRVLSWDGTDTHLAVGCKDSSIQIWDINRLVKIAQWNTGQRDIQALCWTRKGYRLISGDSNGVIKIWHAAKGQIQQEFDTGAGPITALAISPHTSLLCSGHEGGVLSVWKIRRR